MTSLVLRPGYICTFQESFDVLLGFSTNRRNSLLHSASHRKIDGELRFNKLAIFVARIVLLLPELRGFAPSRDTRDFVARRNIDISQAQKHGTGFPQEHDTRRPEIDPTRNPEGEGWKAARACRVFS
jgi:hypothetical protein